MMIPSCQSVWTCQKSNHQTISSALDLSKSYLIKLFKPNQTALKKKGKTNKQINQKELYQCSQQNLREELWNPKKKHITYLLF